MNNFIPQEDYNKFLESMVLCCVDIVIVHEQKVLLVKRDTEPAKDQWWLPGGRLYKGEFLEDCARRKAIEEVGIECNTVRQLCTKETMFDIGIDNIPIHSINTCFLLQPINNSPQVKLDSFSSDYKWVSTIPEDLDNPYVTSVICKALPHLISDSAKYMMEIHPY